MTRLVLLGATGERAARLTVRLAATGLDVRAVPDLDDRAGIRAALRDCCAVLAVTVDAPDAAAELARGRNVINAVAASELDYFVLCASSRELEQYATSLDLPMTFIHAAEGAAANGVAALEGVVADMFANPAGFVGRTLTVAR